MSKVKPDIGWRLRHPMIYLLSLIGHWEWEHLFKTCPAGERHCQHMYWRPGRDPVDKHYEGVRDALGNDSAR